MGSILYPDLDNSQVAVLISLFTQLKHLEKTIKKLQNTKNDKPDVNAWLNKLIDLLRKRWFRIFWEIMRITNQELLVKMLQKNQADYITLQQQLVTKLQQLFLNNTTIRELTILELGKLIKTKQNLIMTYNNFLINAKYLLAPNGILEQTITTIINFISKNKLYLQDLTSLQNEHPDFSVKITKDKQQTEQINTSLTVIKLDSEDLMNLIKQYNIEIQYGKKQEESLLHGLIADKKQLVKHKQFPKLTLSSPLTIMPETKVPETTSLTTSATLQNSRNTINLNPMPLTNDDLAQINKITKLITLITEIKNTMLECNSIFQVQQEKHKQLQIAKKIVLHNKKLKSQLKLKR